MTMHQWILNRQTLKYEHKIRREGSWEHEGSIDLVSLKQGHKCGGDLYGPADAPAPLDTWAVCLKCGAEISRRQRGGRRWR